ncbi:Target of rapamycin complex 1 subunit kog1 [Malassezia vespertilionis]|uniref:Raptor N-terminal CASPase-like domain-containing protein n=1 Tax=Malassezia vespertilionis TaxID=2020962 RepID=A0A2N1J798_9BASI|nr:Target of rapamycin complex 1 subunit kog1 [Malassezia vespertilionis]PKI82421.1 hypothetical protein MVES_003631 [Malassezia vespertilionis]WFD08021.1 Target of rapamycin complex 1 subunit kog1 [Malassezia vespertilionis]
MPVATRAAMHASFSSEDACVVEEPDDNVSTISADLDGERHGALLQPESEDWMLLESPYMTHWTNKRHTTSGDPRPRRARDMPDWRMRERLRTVTAALVMCLNIGVDPPDVSKTKPSSKLICWMDPESLDPSKALPAIGRNLQVQFETLSMKTRYKQYLDPIVEETKRFCTNLRRTAKDERVLFYYNGFGVPKPTPGGEVWVFNKAYTQYIPVTLYDLQTWLGSPCIYVWDASAAGNIVHNSRRLAEARAEEEVKVAASEGRPPPPIPNADGIVIDADGEPQFPLRESIHLAGCGADEVLPMNPDLPADLFTCCLTSPIEISLRWFVLQNPLPSSLNVDMVMSIPGRLQDRRTPLGELNWILTAVTDTIAWTVLPRALFRRFFRDDLMVAALLRNYLLAQRIMRFYHCTPVSYPSLPDTHDHPLWASWDLAVDQCLVQLPTLLAKEQARSEAVNGGEPIPPHLAAFEYRHSTFFSEQLKAFEVWLSQGDVSRRPPRRRVRRFPFVALGDPIQPDAMEAARLWQEPHEADEEHDPPMQLPIVLQVLLSQIHRLRALILLSQFLDLGPWAVNLALSIGIFPYVLKLLQSPAADLKPVLIYIWARILAVDHSCQVDLLRDNGYMYFAAVLSPFQASTWANGSTLPIPNVSEHRAMCAFILAVFCQDFPAGQAACLEADVMDACLEHLEDDDFLLRQWSALCLAQLWGHNEAGKARAIAKDAHGKLCCLLSDASPEVRAAMLFALGVLLGTSASAHDPLDKLSAPKRDAHKQPLCIGTGSATGLAPGRQRSLEVGIAVAVLSSATDCSPLVRKELVVTLSALVASYESFFTLAAYLYYACDLEQIPRRGMLSSAQITAEVNARLDMEDTLLADILTLVMEHDQSIEAQDIANIPTIVSLFVALLDLSVDPHMEVSALANTVVDRLLATVFNSGLLQAHDSALRLTSPAPIKERRTIHTRVGKTAPKVASAANPSALERTVQALSKLGYGAPMEPLLSSEAHPSHVTVAGPKIERLENGHVEHVSFAHYTSPYTNEPTTPSPTDRRSGATTARTPQHAATILAAMMANDLHRLHTRSTTQDLTRLPATPDMPPIRHDLPLTSRLFAWCSEYYTEPQMKSAEADEPGSWQYNWQTWRRQRSERQSVEAIGAASRATRGRWNMRAGKLIMPAPPAAMAFQEFENLLVVASEERMVRVYDWEERRLLSTFSNGNPRGTDITSLAFVNEEVDALLLTGAATGNVSIYRDYQHKPQLVSAFRALPDLVRSTYPAGLTVAWQQVAGRLLAAGDCRVIRTWDAHRELCIADVPTHTNSCVTSLTCDSEIGHLFMAGFGDGSIGVYDQRNPPGSSLVRLWEEHNAWVQNLHLQKYGQRELLSASVDGGVRLWDIRARASLVQGNVRLGGNLSSFALHDRAPLFAATSTPQATTSGYVYSAQIYTVQDMKPLGGSIERVMPANAMRGMPPSAYSPSMTQTAFHPQYPLIAFGGLGGIVELRKYD